MKAKIFTKAWELFKAYSITFSQALTIAWNDYKKNLLAQAFNKIPSKAQFAKKKAEAKIIWQSFAGVSFRCEPRNIVKTDGAQFFYDGKTFNAD